MKKIIYLSLLMFPFLMSTNSFAGLLVEPLIGFNLVDTLSVDGGKNYKSGGGMAYGGRLGYQKGPFQIGGDYLKNSINMTDNDFDRNLETQEYGAFVGFEFPILFRAYAEYIFAVDGGTKINGEKRALNDATGGKIGLGFTLLPFIDINLDYRKLKFEDEDIDIFMIGLSLPVEFFK
jgi:hypothetical protein